MENGFDEDTSHTHNHRVRIPVRDRIWAKSGTFSRAPVRASAVERQRRRMEYGVDWQLRGRMEERRRIQGARGAGEKLHQCKIDAAGLCGIGPRRATYS